MISIIKQMILIAIISLFLLIGGGYIFLEYIATDFKCEKVTVGKDCIYLKYRVYTNDDPTIFISTSKSRRIDPSTDYIYERSECLFYQIQNDTIFIFDCDIANQPPKFKPKIHIIQKPLSNSQFIGLHMNYKTFGYEHFPHYNEHYSPSSLPVINEAPASQNDKQ